MIANEGNDVAQLVASSRYSPVIQFSILVDGKTLSSNYLLKILTANDVSVLAVSFLENFETVVARFIVNYPDTVRKVFSEKMIKFYETQVLAIELDCISDMMKLSNAVFAAELKAHYMYSFLTRPGGKVGLILQTENNEFATNVLSGVGIKLISQDDIAR